MVVVSHFLKWIYTARVSERAAAANALARAYVNSELPFEDRCAAEAALTLLLDDASSKVRLAMAEALSMSHHAPLQIISVLAADQPEVAGVVLARSPLLTDADLINRVAASQKATQKLIADRPLVSMALSAAIAEIGEAEACAVLLANTGAAIASMSFRRMAERHGHLPLVREALISDIRLPADCRHMLLIKLGETLKTSPLVMALMGAARAERVMREACVKASVTLIEGTRQEEHAALIEHLRLRGDLTASFLIRTIAHGKVDFFGSALVALSQQSEPRVRALLASGHDVALQALFRSAGLAAATHAVILRALKIWREVANGKRVAGVQEVSWLMLKELGGQSAEGDLAALVKSIHLDALRENARGHALAIAAA
ncbi:MULTISPECIES: DUF2336 domain-containing protein [unclassified Mesorhizobium]|uniref:DUF2336 domain-containing protein n=1 Tax=unclassified Mesorhizobium TaxID=325217 RepID=UPI000FDA3C8D|nr:MULTISPECIES: DUF2336 domain-containing protein [unclassified Mesorhizobium]TGR38937.1 DUF2336 domain-containing protein [bacterium M00.F.Ca.ET.199.01.1.1]TGU27549.1 DUF2336 domain-containing protein [bacterium M00.F.Ca.ET.156.01.1.1]TGV61376.1 DUF2336 domain-containing protein [bacterium M00.F.Ca.ET.141.01.1.1]TGV83973.1 DUF2336 domain-containing protein [Mesorhizobium sp. M00.F.Ca.ET.149.01.1.1]TIS93291.1 MAG: DUF2336 domain-containing protein [Mesorhizobium sp.]